jgi:hypothetical protein
MPTTQDLTNSGTGGTGATGQLPLTRGDEIASSRSSSGAAVGGAVGGVIVGVLVLVAVIAIILVVIYSRRKHRSKGKQQDHGTAAMDNAGYGEGANHMVAICHICLNRVRMWKPRNCLICSFMWCKGMSACEALNQQKCWKRISMHKIGCYIDLEVEPLYGIP